MPGNRQDFYLNSVTGDLSIVKNLDYEDATYEIIIEAQDGPGLLSRAKILVTVLDEHTPRNFTITFTESVPEESTAGREIALINRMIGIPGKMDRLMFLSLEICHLI